MKDLSTEIIKILVKNLKTQMEKEILCSWMERLLSAKMSILTQTAHTFNAIPTILPMVFFTKTEQTILTAAWNHKGP